MTLWLFDLQLLQVTFKKIVFIIYTTDLLYFYTIKYMHTINFILHSNIKN